MQERHYEKTRNVDNITHVISHYETAVSSITPDLGVLPAISNNSYFHRFERNGDLQDNAGIRGLDLNSPGDQYKSFQLPNAHPVSSTNALETRFQQLGRIEDLEDAISSHREALPDEDFVLTGPSKRAPVVTPSTPVGNTQIPSSLSSDEDASERRKFLDSLTTEKPYSYQSLATASTIRLIRASSERVNGNIRCTLHHVDTLDMQGPQYHALSYCWGDQKHTNRIYIGDPQGDTYLRHIHENLWQFLNYVWEQGKFDLFFWTDCLCLNQSNADEIAKQVPRMGDIYATAEEVIIWLGHDQRGQDAMRLVTTRDWPESVDWSADVGDEEYETWRENAISVEETREEMAAAAEYLLLLSYWSRVWIVQEVVLARRVCVAYGSISLDLDEFCCKMNPFRDHKSEYNYQPTVWLLCEYRKGGRNKPLWSLIDDFELCQSTLVLDRVYGFLGMAAKHDDGTSPTEHMEVSYDKRPFEVFFDMAFELLAPWDKYPGILLSLRKLLFCRPASGEAGPDHDDVRRLEEYARHSRTSNRHARFADLALLVLDAVNAIIPFMVPNFQEWTKAACTLLKSATQSRLKPTLHQNAAVVGLVLTVLHEELHSSWKVHRESEMGDELPHSSGWRCAAHRDEDGQGYPIINDLQECPQAQFTLDASLVTKACGRHSQSCNWSMMSFEIPEIGFRLIITPDIRREVVEPLPLKALPAIFGIQAESSEWRRLEFPI